MTTTSVETQNGKTTDSGVTTLPVYPFTAIVGQAELKLALLLCVIDPTIGGVMVMGHRGTAKSTAVRALAALLPPQRAVAGCPYGCDPAAPSSICPHCAAPDQDAAKNGQEKRRASAKRPPSVLRPVPVVDLPLGATEDRVVGALDIERALVEGVQTFAPGLLARANRGFLYIDEVNLLEDHLVDLLLDVAQSGVNVVEREGISVRHPARFVLVGSGNPEEGDLRPQLLDRFGLHARITTIDDVAERVEIVKRRRAFDADPVAFAQQWEREQQRLQRRIRMAQKRLPSVELTDEALYAAARLCVALNIDGHRGELTLARAAVALAAFEGRESAQPSDIARVATLSLRHRLRKDPLETSGDDARIERAVAETIGAAARA
ncbi:magnesium chelatase ATPase subunit I [Roseiflexus castenholzii]|jgi:magnesium chelatase subunit I|uniref:Mg-protoporphyrin IX chelatase n=1 Tax=Roseiflexus castenholzii (strain DSM 13941 / HLO8) TaxID=383372 RepID=A7NJG7_ROSCS|nr:magnesium chelatase ATPase subunit I [Roseiflexus castenholzii]ABU57637.1 magnesium chelatase ATPase subunit I [Roseiflexus castenholzii DSM 13941]